MKFVSQSLFVYEDGDVKPYVITVEPFSELQWEVSLDVEVSIVAPLPVLKRIARAILEAPDEEGSI